MSVVTVQLGQCGNQIGTQLFSTLHRDATASLQPSPYREVALDRYFHSFEAPRQDKEGAYGELLQARAVLVDMESKVVQNSLATAKKSESWTFDEKCVYSEKRGSGNNWANGYLNHAPACKDVVMDMVRRQAEKCDHLDSFLVLMSVAGGTGSGVGARLTEYLVDAYPDVTLLNPIIWPYPSGEVIVQDYNSLLTTSHLQSCSSAVLLLQNQQLHKVCSQLLHMKEISMVDINTVVAHSLASFLQPAVPFGVHVRGKYGGGSGGGGGEGGRGGMRTEDSLFYSHCRPSDLVTSLCPHPLYKFLSIKTIPQILDSTHAYTHYLWAGLLKSLRQMLLTDSPTEEGMDWSVTPPNQGPRIRGRGSCHSNGGGSRVNMSLANVLILRGNDLDQADVSIFHEPRLYSGHAPASHTCSAWCSSHAFNKYEKCSTLVSNSQSCVDPLEGVCGKAWDMFSSRAYLHQYKRFGLTQEDFMDSFVSVEQVLKDYWELSC